MTARTNSSGCRSDEFPDPGDVRAAAELARAERADARHSSSPAQVTGLAAATRCDGRGPGREKVALRPTTENPPSPPCIDEPRTAATSQKGSPP